VDGAESELERQEVKVRKGRKLKKEVCVEAGKEESLENKKQIDTAVSEALLKVLETLPADTKAFPQPALAPPAASKKRETENVPSQVQAAKKSKSSKSVAAADGVSVGLIDVMVAQLNKGIFGKMGNCSMIEKVSVPNVDTMTSYSTSNRSKTILEDVYGFTPDVESLPVVGCFACRLEETKTRTDKKLGVRNSVGTFVGFSTYRNVYGVVILTGKDTQIVGSLHVVFDSLFMSFKDKPTTNPRLETLYRVLGRVNDTLKSNSCNNGTVQASDSGGNPKDSDEGDSEDEGCFIPEIIQDDNILVDDDAESSNDDVVDNESLCVQPFAHRGS
jgi:hypothetical protein